MFICIKVKFLQVDDFRNVSRGSAIISLDGFDTAECNPKSILYMLTIEIPYN